MALSKLDNPYFFHMPIIKGVFSSAAVIAFTFIHLFGMQGLFKVLKSLGLIGDKIHEDKKVLLQKRNIRKISTRKVSPLVCLVLCFFLRFSSRFPTRKP